MSEEMFNLIKESLWKDAAYYGQMSLKELNSKKSKEYVNKAETYLKAIEVIRKLKKESSITNMKEEILKYNIWFHNHCMYYDGWNIKIPLGDKYPEVYTEEEIYDIYLKEQDELA